MSSRNLFASRLMACLLAVGFLGVAPMTNDASAGKSVRKPAKAAGIMCSRCKRRGRGPRIPLPMGPSYHLLRLSLLLQPRALPDAYRGLRLLSAHYYYTRSYLSRSWILSAARGARRNVMAVRWQMRMASALDVETCKARLDDIEARLKRGKLDAAEADAARLALLSQLRSSSWGFGQDLRRATRSLIVPAAVFLLVAGIGAAASYVADPPEAAGSADTNSASCRAPRRMAKCLRSLDGLHAFHWSRGASVYAGRWQTAA